MIVQRNLFRATPPRRRSPRRLTTPTHCYRNLSSGGAVGGQNGTREQNSSDAGRDEAPARTQGNASRPHSAPPISAGGDCRGRTQRRLQDERRVSHGSAVDGRNRRGERRTPHGSAIDGRASRREDARRTSFGSVVGGRYRRGETACAGGARQSARVSGGRESGGSRRFGGKVSHARPAGIKIKSVQCFLVSHAPHSCLAGVFPCLDSSANRSPRCHSVCYIHPLELRFYVSSYRSVRFCFFGA